MIEFYLDRSAGTPTYVQLVQQVRQALRTGVLAPGDRLPTAAAVVTQLAVNPNTVLKAYRELEREGLVEPRPGQGTFVRRSLGNASAAGRAKLQRDLTRALQAARQAGLETEDIEAVFAAVLHQRAGRGVA
ncbi:GntR family transcriptional regulator [Asanoa siamensis]|uniref:GntR family transcriptional regulator n=1 Tax=Asanoa siamensis TaxID=926357 RepID=A0ABQ4D4W2_9ACTN|nr:GntR family transcriptional regulator [Asanoa siamensis]GIF78575.1 GntR family transcriptional regulator [Asanoa siamensis]